MSSNPSATIGDLVKRMQHDAQLWNDLLWTSGGKLELPKCGYHTVYYTFKPNGTPILHQAQVPSASAAEASDPFTFEYDTTTIHTQHQITIRFGSVTPISITAKDVTTPRKNLGHFKSPSRCTKALTP